MDTETKPIEGEKTNDDKKVAVLFHVDLDLRKRFKAACKSEGATMAAILSELMERYVNKSA